MSDQNKQQNKLEELKGKSSSLNLSELSFLRDNPDLIYLYKKTEKLVSAIYLISNFISDKEPLKWQMRESGLSLLSLSIKSGSVSASQTNYISAVLVLLSLIEILYVSRLISEMNYNIIKYEFELLIRTAESAEKGSNQRGLIFPEHFFEISQGQDSNQGETLTTGMYKGHKTMSDSLSFRKSVETVRPSEQKQKDKTNRQDIIISLLTKGGELSIKDFTSSIKDCSEKTIQRELVSLVYKGQVKKVGEKRWSRYSLK